MINKRYAQPLFMILMSLGMSVIMKNNTALIKQTSLLVLKREKILKKLST